MIRDAERFAKLASGVQSIVIATAFIVGGAWTFYTFNSQLQVQNAQAQLAKLERELEEEPRVELDLDISAIDSPAIDNPAKERRFFVGTLSAKNVGTDATILKLHERPIELFKVSVDRAGKEAWTSIRHTEFRWDDERILNGLVLQVGAVNKVSFIITVDSPGLYVTVISAERTAAESTAARADTTDNKGQIYWSTQRYFVVK